MKNQEELQRKLMELGMKFMRLEAISNYCDKRDEMLDKGFKKLESTYKLVMAKKNRVSMKHFFFAATAFYMVAQLKNVDRLYTNLIAEGREYVNEKYLNAHDLLFLADAISNENVKTIDDAVKMLEEYQKAQNAQETPTQQS